jgi:hypothetical protein
MAVEREERVARALPRPRAPRNLHPERMQPFRAATQNKSKLSPAEQAALLMCEEERAAKARECFVMRATEKYTAVHLAAVHTAVKPWPLYGEHVNGKRINNVPDARHCHQCRQKTRGKRIRCTGCCLPSRDLCGDCLWMRYGENLDEAAADPEWLCPVCRDIWCALTLSRTHTR